MSDATNTPTNGTSESEQGMRVEGGEILFEDVDGVDGRLKVTMNGNLMVDSGSACLILSRCQAAALAPILAHYARTGRLENPPAAGELDRDWCGNELREIMLGDGRHCVWGEAEQIFRARYQEQGTEFASRVLARYAAPAPIALQPAGVVEALKLLVRRTGQRDHSHKPDCICVFCEKWREAFTNAQQVIISALPSSGGEGVKDYWHDYYRSQKRLAESLIERDALRAQVVTLEAERDDARHVAGCLTDEKAKLWAEVERLRAECKSWCKAYKERVKRFKEQIKAMQGNEVPTPPDPRRVVEGMRVVVNEKSPREETVGLHRTIRKAPIGSGVVKWELVDDQGIVANWFYNDVGLPDYYDPMPAEPVEAKGVQSIEFTASDYDNYDPTPPIPEPAGEILLPEDAAGNIKFDDTSMVLPSVKFEGKWFAITKDGWNLKDVAERTAYFPTPQAAAIALRDIGQGPGAVVEDVVTPCPRCGTATNAPLCDECITQDLKAHPEAQPAPPPFDVEKFGAGIIEGVCHYILEMFPGIREDAHGKAVENSIDAMKAALGGKE